MFAKGQLVDVTGITKGRGFQGVMRRWSFERLQTKTHGTHEYRRHPGAIGQRKTPGRVYPNKKMPGHYGVEQVTTQNLDRRGRGRWRRACCWSRAPSPATTTASSTCGPP